VARKAEKWPNRLENIVNGVQENVVKDIKDANISIKVDSSGNKVEITTSINKKSRVELLEELEKGKKSANDTVPRKK
jgi:hypothetical protein